MGAIFRVKIIESENLEKPKEQNDDIEELLSSEENIEEISRPLFRQSGNIYPQVLRASPRGNREKLHGRSLLRRGQPIQLC